MQTNNNTKLCQMRKTTQIKICDDLDGHRNTTTNVRIYPSLVNYGRSLHAHRNLTVLLGRPY